MLTYNFDNQFASGATYDGQGNPTSYKLIASISALVEHTSKDRTLRLVAGFNRYTYYPYCPVKWKQHYCPTS